MSGDCGESMHRDEHGDLPKAAPRSYPLSGPSPRERLTVGESVGVRPYTPQPGDPYVDEQLSEKLGMPVVVDPQLPVDMLFIDRNAFEVPVEPDGTHADPDRLDRIRALHSSRLVQLYLEDGTPAGEIELCAHCMAIARAGAKRTLTGRAASQLLFPCPTRVLADGGAS